MTKKTHNGSNEKKIHKTPKPTNSHIMKQKYYLKKHMDDSPTVCWIQNWLYKVVVYIVDRISFYLENEQL